MAEDRSENLANAHHWLDHARAVSSRGTAGGPDMETATSLGIGYALLALVDEIDELRKQLRES